MKRIFITAAFAALMGVLVGQTALGSTHWYESHVYFHNETSAWVWVTVYRFHFDPGTAEEGVPGKPQGAWCVAPGKSDQHGLRTRIDYVRVEISVQGCQRLPVQLNHVYDFPTKGKDASSTGNYYVRGTDGHYLVWK
jgi:hypothetical protein